MSASYFSINKDIGDFLPCTASIDRKADKSRNTTFLSGVPVQSYLCTFTFFCLIMFVIMIYFNHLHCHLHSVVPQIFSFNTLVITWTCACYQWWRVLLVYRFFILSIKIVTHRFWILCCDLQESQLVHTPLLDSCEQSCHVCDDELVEVLDRDAFPSMFFYCISLLCIALSCFVTHHFAFLRAVLLCLICIALLHFETRVK